MNLFSEYVKAVYSKEAEEVNIDIDVNEQSAKATQTEQWGDVFDPLEMTPSSKEVEDTADQIASLESVYFTLANIDNRHLDNNHIALVNLVIPSMEGLGSFVSGVAKNVAMKEVGSMVAQGVKALIQKIIEYIVRAAKWIYHFFKDLPNKMRRLRAKISNLFAKEEKIPESGVPLPDNIVQMSKKNKTPQGIELVLKAPEGYNFSGITTFDNFISWLKNMQAMTVNVKNVLPDVSKFTKHISAMAVGATSDSNPNTVIHESGLNNAINKPFNAKRVSFKLNEGKIVIDDPSHDFYSKVGMDGKMLVGSKEEILAPFEAYAKELSSLDMNSFHTTLESYSKGLEKIESTMKNVTNKGTFTVTLSLLFSFIKSAEWSAKGIGCLIESMSNSLA